jgi:hypothetical protein
MQQQEFNVRARMEATTAKIKREVMGLMLEILTMLATKKRKKDELIWTH